MAVAAVIMAEVRGPSRIILPSYDDFRQIEEKAKEGAGFDGCTAIGREPWRTPQNVKFGDGENKEIEHIGILAVPDRPDIEIKASCRLGEVLEMLEKD